MGLRRGLSLGFLMGAIGMVLGRRAQDEVEREGSEPNRRFKDLLDDARAQAGAERESTEARMRRRFSRARETGSLPPEDGPAQ